MKIILTTSNDSKLLNSLYDIETRQGLTPVVLNHCKLSDKEKVVAYTKHLNFWRNQSLWTSNVHTLSEIAFLVALKMVRDKLIKPEELVCRQVVPREVGSSTIITYTTTPDGDFEEDWEDGFFTHRDELLFE